MKEIANWEMGRAARSQTNNCLDLIDALQDMMNPHYVFESANPDELKYQRATEIKPHHEFRALKELSKCGHGSQTRAATRRNEKPPAFAEGFNRCGLDA